MLQERLRCWLVGLMRPLAQKAEALPVCVRHGRCPEPPLPPSPPRWVTYAKPSALCRCWQLVLAAAAVLVTGVAAVCCGVSGAADAAGRGG